MLLQAPLVGRLLRERDVRREVSLELGLLRMRLVEPLHELRVALVHRSVIFCHVDRSSLRVDYGACFPTRAERKRGTPPRSVMATPSASPLTARSSRSASSLLAKTRVPSGPAAVRITASA